MAAVDTDFLTRVATAAGWSVKSDVDGNLLWVSPQGKEVFRLTAGQSGTAIKLLKDALNKHGLTWVAPPHAPSRPPTYLVCPRCKETKAMSNFSTSATADGRCTQCVKDLIHRVEPPVATIDQDALTALTLDTAIEMIEELAEQFSQFRTKTNASIETLTGEVSRQLDALRQTQDPISAFRARLRGEA